MAAHERHALLREALEAVGSRLAGGGIWHCLAFGTLLGAVRGGDVIAWDHDIDLFVRPCDLVRIVDSARHDDALDVVPLSLDSSQLALRPGGSGGVAAVAVPALTMRFRGSAVGELWAPVLFADGVLRLYDLETETVLWPHSAFPAFLLEELRELDVGGRSYPGPAHAEPWLAWIYGEDWRVPRRAPADGGVRRRSRGSAGERVEPALAEQIAWCVDRGWDRSRYAGQPAWPRTLGGAGPPGRSERAADTSGSDWWQTLEEVAGLY